MGSNRIAGTRARGLLVLVAFALMCPAAAAQVSSPGESGAVGFTRSAYGLGLFAGYASGIGLSFRHHLPGRFSYQLTGGIIKQKDRLWYTFGAEGQFDLSRMSAYRVYVAAGAAYYFEGPENHNEVEGPERIGLGVGGELSLGERFTLEADLLFTWFSDGTILPLPQAGIYYYFD